MRAALKVIVVCVALGACSGVSSARKAEVHKTSRTNPSIPASVPATRYTQQFEQVALSPDGKTVAWVETQMDKQGAKTGKHDLYVAEYEKNGPPRRITGGPSATEAHYDERDVAWSLDSKQLAFLSDAAKKGQLQLYVAREGGAPRKLTRVQGFLATPKWSPDGKTIAVLYTENATRVAGPLVAETPETGVIKDAFFEQRLALVDVATGKLRQITPANTYIYEYAWAPNGKSIALTAAEGNGDDNWYIARLYVVDTGSEQLRLMYKPKLQIARPAVSPDGKSIAFIEGLMSDEDSVGGDVFLISLDGGAPRNLTPERKASAVVVSWTRDGRLIDMENADQESSIARIDPKSGRIEVLYHAPELLTCGFWSSSLSFTPDGSTAAMVRSSFSTPPEVWAGGVGNWKQVTHRNSDLQRSWGEAKSLHWKSDGLDVQGWLIYPKEFDASKNYSMIVAVHGGPGDGVQSSWPAQWDFETPLAGHGYFAQGQLWLR